MISKIQAFVDAVKAGQSVEFQDTMAIIAECYAYTPVRYSNGLGEDRLVNEPGTNEGSCKIFSFGRLNGLSEAETLALFGRYYREDVLGHPAGADHQNIRRFMKHGWAGIFFENEALKPRWVTQMRCSA